MSNNFLYLLLFATRLFKSFNYIIWNGLNNISFQIFSLCLYFKNSALDNWLRKLSFLSFLIKFLFVCISLSLSVSLSVYPFSCVSVSLGGSVWQSHCLKVSVAVCMSLNLYVSLSGCPSVCLSFCLSVPLSILAYIFFIGKNNFSVCLSVFTSFFYYLY